jgi:small-conductance mechanosensitive channel
MKYLLEALPSIVWAVLLLIVAFAVAALAKYIVTKILEKVNAKKITDKIGITDEETGSSIEFIGKLVFLIVFLLFLPGVLDRLGMQNVSAPITSMVSQFLDYLPNILAAAVVLVIGLFIAKLIRQLLTPLLKKLNVDRLQEKAGISPTEGTTLSSILAYIIYILILIPVIIAALQILNITAISAPAIAMLNRIVSFLPNIFSAIAIIVIGTFIAKIIGKLLTGILSGVGTDKILEKVITREDAKAINVSLSKIIGEFVKYVIILFFVVEGFNVLNLEILRVVGQAIIAYLPLVISAVIIMGIAIYVANWIEKLIVKKFADKKIIACLVKTVILTLAAFMTFIQLGIAPSIVNSAFIIILGALAVAFAISFGIGGREFAKNLLHKLEEKYSSDETNDTPS